MSGTVSNKWPMIVHLIVCTIEWPKWQALDPFFFFLNEEAVEKGNLKICLRSQDVAMELGFAPKQSGSCICKAEMFSKHSPLWGKGVS